MGSSCLLEWTSALLAQLALCLRADREGMELPLRMPGFPWFTVVGLLLLAAIFTVGFMGEDSRPQLLSTFGLVVLLAVANWPTTEIESLPRLSARLTPISKLFCSISVCDRLQIPSRTTGASGFGWAPLRLHTVPSSWGAMGFKPPMKFFATEPAFVNTQPPWHFVPAARQSV